MDNSHWTKNKRRIGHMANESFIKLERRDTKNHQVLNCKF